MSEANRGIRKMEAMIERQKRELRTLVEEKIQLEANYTNPKTSDSERGRIEERLRKLLLPQIIRLQKSILSQSKMTNALKKKFKTIQTLKNRKEQQNARVASMMPKAPNKPSLFQGLFTRKAAPAAKAAGQGNHLTAKERRELNELEAELLGSIAAYAPSTTTTTSTNTNAVAANLRRRLNTLRGPTRGTNNLQDFEAELMASNEWKAMEAKNAVKNQLKRNIAGAKTENQRKYYKNMLRGIENANNLGSLTNGTENLNAMLNQLEGIGAGAGSGVKPPTAEEIKELEDYLAGLEGGRRNTRRRR